MNKNKLVIVGDSAFAEIAYEYFRADSGYEVVGFAVEEEFLKKDVLIDLPVVPFERVETIFDPDSHDIFVAITYIKLNRVRARLAVDSKGKGYQLASYISSQSFLWGNVQIGEHCFVFENNTIQPFVEIGNNVVLWSGNHIGHHSKIGDNCFISSHVVISGFCSIGNNSFLGVNSTLADQVTIGQDNWIGPGVTILKDTPENQLYGAMSSEPSRVSAKRFFKIKD